MIHLAEHKLCTACGTCSARCPKSCIRMEPNSIGTVYPVIDSDNCIECHACEKVCPVLDTPTVNYPRKAYAAWSNNTEERRTSASGGIAAELYRYALSQGYMAVGASQNEDFSVTHKLASNEKEIAPFKNSKYVFSDAYDVLPKIKSIIKGGNKVIFVGLPCQVAALRKIIKEDDKVILADLVCHGTTPVEYLRQHISHIERSMGKTTHRMSFRDPEKLTYTYTFALYDKDDNCFYAQRTKDGDTYQYGYHRGISYRENCYHCQYAKPERVSDITLCDYSGLGKLAPCDYGHRKVSCILTNTERGDKFIQNLISEGNIHADLRPVEEPIAGDQRLRGQLPKSKARKDFERLIVENANDFEKTMGQVVRRDTRRMKISRFVQMPKRIARKLKRIIYR